MFTGPLPLTLLLPSALSVGYPRSEAFSRAGAGCISNMDSPRSVTSEMSEVGDVFLVLIVYLKGGEG